MRIAFVGKGGSGKTTLSTAFATYLHNEGEQVLLIDADVNVHVHGLLGIARDAVRPIAHYVDTIVDHVRGERTDMAGKPFISATPPGKGSRMVRMDGEDPLLHQLVTSNDKGLRLLSVGTYEGEDVGFTCYHGKTDGLITLLHHLLDGPRDYVVADSVTGIDNLGGPLRYCYDMKVVVVEPTQKSLQVYTDFVQGFGGAAYAPRIVVLGNKVHTAEDEAYLRAHIDAEHLLGFLPRSRAMKQVDQGQREAFEEFVDQCAPLFREIVAIADTLERDWDRYLEQIRNNFRQMATEYYNNYYGVDLELGIDTTFSFHDVLSNVSAH